MSLAVPPRPFWLRDPQTPEPWEPGQQPAQEPLALAGPGHTSCKQEGAEAVLASLGPGTGRCHPALMVPGHCLGTSPSPLGGPAPEGPGVSRPGAAGWEAHPSPEAQWDLGSERA